MILKEIIDDYYKEQNKLRRKGQKKFWISDAGECPRVVFFKFKEAPQKELEPNVLRIFERGDYIHEKIRRVLFSKGLIQASEVEIPPEEIISGRADAIVNINGQLYVLDIKSVDGRKFQTIKDEPLIENVCQLQLYLHFFKIEKGILLYESKDSSELKEFVIPYNKEMVEKLLKGIENLFEKVENDIIPARLPDYPYNKRCKYCRFREICDMAEAGEMNWQDFKNKIENLENLES